MPQTRGRDYYGDTSEGQKGLTTEYASDDTKVKEIKKEMTVSESNETFGDRFNGVFPSHNPATYRRLRLDASLTDHVAGARKKETFRFIRD